jgi:NHL repeat
VLVLVPSAAFAARAHVFGSAFGGSGSGSGGLSLSAGGPGAAASSVAVDGVSGDVFVADTGNHRVDELSSTGVFVSMFGGEVDKTTKGDVCTAASGDQCGVGVSGSAPGEFEDPVFVAVDEGSGGGGEVYVADAGDELVSKFDAQGEVVTGWGNNGLGEAPDGQLYGTMAHGKFGAPSGLAVDGAGNLWVYVGGTVETGHNEMYEFDRAGGELGELWQPDVNRGGYAPQGIGLNASDDVYVVEDAEKVQEYSGFGGWLGTVAHPETEDVKGVTVDPSQDGVYLDQSIGVVDYYSTECAPSTVSAQGCSPTQEFGAGDIGAPAGLAVDPVSGTVFVADSATNQVDVFPVSVEANTLPASNVTATSVQLNGEVNPEGAELEGCRFEYGETTTYTGSVPCEESDTTIGSGHGLVAVRANVSGLAGGSYHFRLVAHNANGLVHSEDQAFEALALASIDQLESTQVTASSAKLVAQINPNGVTGTAYHFEYDTVPYQAREAPHGTGIPVPDQSIATGNADVEVSQQITGLTPDTTYYFRAVVTDADGVAASHQGTFIDITKPISGKGSCPDETLREESNINPATREAASLGLPDCRAYEMVSPPVKNGSLLGSKGVVGLDPAVAEGGSTVLASSLQCFANASSCTGARQTSAQSFAFTRGASGWSPESLTPAANEFTGDTVKEANPAAGTVWFSAVSKATGFEELFVREQDGAVHAVGPVGPVPGSSIGFLKGDGLVTTPDGGTVVWNERDAGWVFGGHEEGSLFEYSGFGKSRPELVAVSGGEGSADLIGGCGEEFGSASRGARDWLGSLSADGSTVYFSVLPCPQGGTGANAGIAVPALELYARVHGSQTVLISTHATETTGGPAEECVQVQCVASAPRDASFEGASRDGSRVFFSSTQALTDSAQQDPSARDTARSGGCLEASGGASGCNLYESECAGSCKDPSARRLVDVSAGDTSEVGPRVQGVIAISPDGSHVYFVAQGGLTSEANTEGLEPVAGGDNLYVYERDSSHPAGHLAFIHTLPGGTETAEHLEWQNGPQDATANVTPDGSVLVFPSYGALTPDARKGAGSQIYRYDATTGLLNRVSIGAGGGFDDDGNAGGGAAMILSAAAGLIEQGGGRPDPSMSDDGSRVFFSSPKGLTPGALNEVPAAGHGNVEAQNVYEWEADGKGSCGESQGCVYLISDGLDREEGTGLIGVDATGDNVFFSTVDELVGQDTDTELDYYDARVEGGFPRPRVQTSCASSEDCHPGGSGPSGGGAPGSATFSGPGNLALTVVKLPSVKPKTTAEKLVVALKACRKEKAKRRRVACEHEAHRRYPVKSNSKPTLKRSVKIAHVRNQGRGK